MSPIELARDVASWTADPPPSYGRRQADWRSGRCAAPPILAFLLMLAMAACGSDPVGTDPPDVEGEGDTEVIDTVSVELPVDNGESGVVIDTRDIFRKGYVASSVDISFPGHAAFDATLDVDPVTNLAILRIHNDDLSEEEREAFADGIAAEIVVRDASDVVLGQQQEASLVLGHSAVPLAVGSSLPAVLEPLTIKEGVRYLLQPENRDGVVAAGGGMLGLETMTALAQGSMEPPDLVRCPAGSVAVGYGGRVSHDEGILRQVWLECAELGNDLTVATETVMSDALGTSSLGTEANVVCPDGAEGPTVLVRDAGHYEGLMTTVNGFCHALLDVVNGATKDDAVSAGRLGPDPTATSTEYDLFCPRGSAVTGLQGLIVTFGTTDAVGSVSDLGYICRDLLGGWAVRAFVPGDSLQHFELVPVPAAPEDNTFRVRQSSLGELKYWVVEGGEVNTTTTEADADSFILEQDENESGWVRIRVADAVDPTYLVLDGKLMLASTTDTQRFRLLTDDVIWTMTDQGIVYHQPASPPTKLDFAYDATIRNCSPATVTETVGRSESRSRTVSSSTSESLQVFSSRDIGFGVTGSIGYDPPATGGVAASLELSFNMQWTSSTTTATENTSSQSTTESLEVSRTRSLEVPPFSAVEVYDAVRTVEDVRLPFTHVLRIKGEYEDGTALTAAEIVTQLHFNLMEGVVTGVGAEHVDVGIRGVVSVDQLFESETDVNELPGVCN